MNNTKEQTNCICGCHQITPTRHQITFITCALIQSMQTEIAVAYDVRANNRRRTVISDSRDSLRITRGERDKLHHTHWAFCRNQQIGNAMCDATGSSQQPRYNRTKNEQRTSTTTRFTEFRFRPPFRVRANPQKYSLLFVINSGTHKTQSDDVPLVSTRTCLVFSCLLLFVSLCCGFRWVSW